MRKAQTMSVKYEEVYSNSNDPRKQVKAKPKARKRKGKTLRRVLIVLLCLVLLLCGGAVFAGFKIIDSLQPAPSEIDDSVAVSSIRLSLSVTTRHCDYY